MAGSTTQPRCMPASRIEAVEATRVPSRPLVQPVCSGASTSVQVWRVEGEAIDRGTPAVAGSDLPRPSSLVVKRAASRSRPPAAAVTAKAVSPRGVELVKLGGQRNTFSFLLPLLHSSVLFLSSKAVYLWSVSFPD